jgi:ribulose-phosphate 3-epimerase
MTLIAPSLLSSDFANLGEAVASLETGGADWIHLDVMDGHFVPNLTIGPPVIAAIKKRAHLPLDVHLMIEDPDRWIDVYRSAGADTITVHAEACRHLHRTIHRIKESGARAGVSLNPATSVTMIEEVIGDLDMVLVMTVNPGFGAQSFIRHSLQKIRSVAGLIQRSKSAALIEVDGGIDDTTAADVTEAGAGVLVAGNYVFTSPSVADAVRILRTKAAEGVRRRTPESLPRIKIGRAHV